jgi:tripartite-type tricarboxylate transporter receptor subunit TctC
MAARESAPDGYTFLLAGGSMAGAAYVNVQAKYDVLLDFTPVSLLETSPFVMMVHPVVPASTVKDFIALARAQPGKLNYGTPGPGQIPYWSARLFNEMATIQAVEVPYKDTGAIAAAVMAGESDYFFAPANLARNPKLRALAVTTATRSPAFPDLPTVAEAGVPGFEMPAWRSIMGPARVPRDIVRALNAAIADALATTEVREQLLRIGSEPTPSTPEELHQRYADWRERFGKIAKQAGLKPQ